MPDVNIQARSLEETKSKCKSVNRGGAAELLGHLVNTGWRGSLKGLLLLLVAYLWVQEAGTWKCTALMQYSNKNHYLPTRPNMREVNICKKCCMCSLCFIYWYYKGRGCESRWYLWCQFFHIFYRKNKGFVWKTFSWNSEWINDP